MVTVHLNEMSLNLSVHAGNNDLQTESRVEHALVNFVHSATSKRDQLLDLHKTNM